MKNQTLSGESAVRGGCWSYTCWECYRFQSILYFVRGVLESGTILSHSQNESKCCLQQLCAKSNRSGNPLDELTFTNKNVKGIWRMLLALLTKSMKPQMKHQPLKQKLFTLETASPAPELPSRCDFTSILSCKMRWHLPIGLKQTPWGLDVWLLWLDPKKKHTQNTKPFQEVFGKT